MTPPKPHAELTGVDMAAAMAHLNQTLPDDAMLTNGAGNYTVWLHRFYAYRRPRTELAPTCGAMGYGLPAAIAAKLRHPEKTVVCFAGDGCFLMYPQEIATAAAHGANLIVILVNNRMYGTIRMHQEREFPARISATELTNPDFAKLAEAYGAWSVRVETTETFKQALTDAKGRSGLRLIHCLIDIEQLSASGLSVSALRSALEQA